jgi:hypothetical protein
MKTIFLAVLLAAAATAQVPPAPQAAPAHPAGIKLDPWSTGIGNGAGSGFNFAIAKPEEMQYQSGQNALDNHRWEDALKNFNEVISRGGSHADGALYWKAYALNKLGRRDEAVAAIAELRKSFAGSRWLEDAQALELEIKQAAGQPAAPENQSDEELKLLALNGLMRSEPDRALPLVENLLKGTQSPKLKKNAVYVIAQNGSARAQQVLEQIARGGNPDLQVVAVRYLAQQNRNQPKSAQVLSEVYASTSDVNVKREILDAFAAQQNAKALVAIARAEKDPEMKKNVVRALTKLKSPDATEYLLELLK